MELVDTQDLGSCAIMVCEFESHREYHKIHFSYFCIFYCYYTYITIYYTYHNEQSPSVPEMAQFWTGTQVG